MSGGSGLIGLTPEEEALLVQLREAEGLTGIHFHEPTTKAEPAPAKLEAPEAKDTNPFAEAKDTNPFAEAKDTNPFAKPEGEAPASQAAADAEEQVAELTKERDDLVAALEEASMQSASERAELMEAMKSERAQLAAEREQHLKALHAAQAAAARWHEIGGGPGPRRGRAWPLGLSPARHHHPGWWL